MRQGTLRTAGVTTSPESYAAFDQWAQDPYFNQPDPRFDPSYPAQPAPPNPTG